MGLKSHGVDSYFAQQQRAAFARVNSSPSRLTIIETRVTGKDIAGAMISAIERQLDGRRAFEPIQ